MAPGSFAESAPTTAGPRVASPDRERPWETALRAPFRVATFPLRLFGNGLEWGFDFVGPRLFDPKVHRPSPSGLKVAPHIALGSLTDTGIGPAISWQGFPTADSKLDLSGSWTLHDRRRVRLTERIGTGRPVGLLMRADYDYKPNRRFYGIGNETLQSDASYFLFERTNADVAVHLGGSPMRQLRIGGGYSHMSPRRGYHGTPQLEDVFAPASVPYSHQATSAVWYGVSADLAAVDEGRDPSRGAHARGELRRAAGLGSGDPDYDQWELEGRAYIPVFAKRRVIALRLVHSGVEPRSRGSAPLPFYVLAQSQGSTRFAGFTSERFRDRQLILARMEYRWAILYRMSALALYERSQVAPRASAFRLRDSHEAYGGGLRLGLTDASAIRLELAHSTEGLHAMVSLGGDF
ncbi:MAG: BamA/TamA family outer membrane protein [Candidatus Eisenbacteria bacterium]